MAQYAKFYAVLYTESEIEEPAEEAKAAAKAAGLDDIAQTSDEGERRLRTAMGSVNIKIHPDSNQVSDPSVSISFSEDLNPRTWDDTGEKYVSLFDSSLELFCQLATRFNATYAPLFERALAEEVLPSSHPIAENINAIPTIGVYEDALFRELGCTEGLVNRPFPSGFLDRDKQVREPWRIGHVDDQRTLIMMHDRPWIEGGWTTSSFRELRRPREEEQR